MIKEKDLHHSLTPDPAEETPSEETGSDTIGQQRQIRESAQLLQDAQVKRALEILIGYGVFSTINDK
jgi:carboxyl-terminal processing protease